jgi:hypothetical protein
MVDRPPPESPLQPVEPGSRSGDEPGRDPASPGLIPSEVLEAIPKEDRGKVEQFMAMAVGSVNPIAQKITPEHISGLIELAGKDNDNELADRRDTRRIYAVVGIVGLAAIVGFASLLAVKEKNDLLVEVIKLGGIGIGAFLGGYGIGRARQ